MPLSLIEQEGKGVAEHLAEEPMAQMPQVPGPHSFDEVAVPEWTEHRVNPIPEAAEKRAAPGPGVMPGLLEGSQQLQTLRPQLLLELGAPVVAVPHHRALVSLDPLRDHRGLMDIGRGEVKADNDPWPSDQDMDPKAVEGLAQQRVVAEGPLPTEALAAVGARELTSWEREAVHQVEGGIETDLCQQALPDPLLEGTQVHGLPDERGAVARPEGRKEVGVVTSAVGEDGLVLVQRQVLTDELQGDDLAVGKFRGRSSLAEAFVAHDVEQDVVHQAESGYDEMVQVPGVLP